MVDYFTGDLLKSDCNFICHQTNCKGVMGSGIAKQIRENYPKAYTSLLYRFDQKMCMLGRIDVVSLNSEKHIVNIYAEEDYLPRDVKHTEYEAFRKCLRELKCYIFNSYLNTRSAKIGFPDHIGCGLAGGDWNIVKQIIEEEFAGPDWCVQIWKFNPKEI